jgi:hypothetical protein
MIEKRGRLISTTEMTAILYAYPVTKASPNWRREGKQRLETLFSCHFLLLPVTYEGAE